MIAYASEWTDSCHLHVSDIKKKQMLRAVEERDRALAAAVDAAKARFSSPSQRSQMEKAIKMRRLIPSSVTQQTSFRGNKSMSPAEFKKTLRFQSQRQNALLNDRELDKRYKNYKQLITLTDQIN